MSTLAAEKLTSVNPATLEVLGELPVSSREDVAKAVRRAREAFPKWKRLRYATRAKYLEAAKEALLARADEVCEWVTKENGKPRIEAYASEVYLGLEYIQYYLKRARALLAGETVPTPQLAFKGKSNEVLYEPIGVIAIISPWNFPFSIPFTQIVTALLAGNVVVLKPSELTPFVAEQIGKVFEAADLPEGVLEIVQGDGRVGQHLLEEAVDKVIFTGSVATGRKVYEACAPKLRGCVLELGGKDPMLILEDADLDAASSGAVWGAFTNCGQCCASVERVYVPKRLYRRFVEAVVEKTRKLRVGNGLEPNVDVGPLISDRQRQIVIRHVEDARAKGAKVLTGGKTWDELPGYFYLPTVLGNVNHGMTCMREETFGPTLPIQAYKNVTEAVELMNDSHYGLTASIWTRDTGYASQLARRIEAGTVTINDCEFTYALPQCPWGGVKESGLGYTHSDLGFYEVVHPKVISVDKGLIKKKPHWFPYRPYVYNLVKRVGQFTFGDGLVKKVASLF